jgi:hypothetical protein
MSWTAPRTWTVGEVVTAAMMNAHVRDNLKYVHGDSGTIDLADALRFGNASTLRGHRHPYANDRHIESGTLSASLASGAVTNSSPTFTDAFASAPNVTVGFFNQTDPTGGNTSGNGNPAIAWISALSTTGLTIYIRNNSNSNPSTIVGYWIAEGQD